MSVLKKLEEKIQGLFEGGFGRAFKSPVQPVELARKLVKEMEDHKVISVSRIYAPNEYTLFLSPEDAGQFEAYQEQLKADLADYLIGHARKEGYDILSRPLVIMESDEDLQVGEFGIATRMVSAPAVQAGSEASGTGSAEAAPAAPEFSPEMSATVVYRTPPVQATVAMGAGQAGNKGLERERVVLTAGSRVYEVTRPVVHIGRSKHSDMVLSDPNVSRNHAELRRRGQDYLIVDLGSTNGIEVNGKPVGTAVLKDGDVLTLGTTKVRFERKLC